MTYNVTLVSGIQHIQQVYRLCYVSKCSYYLSNVHYYETIEYIPYAVTFLEACTSHSSLPFLPARPQNSPLWQTPVCLW